MRQGVRILAIAAVAVTASCTSAGETTQVGAAAGGALGAGLGAIVGSQTGDVGGGFVIGGLAGAGAGAAVGNALQAQQEAIQSQDEAIERQQQLIRAQNAQIEELRRLTQDGMEFTKPASALPSQPLGIPGGRPVGEQFSLNTAPAPRNVVANVPNVPDRTVSSGQPAFVDNQPAPVLDTALLEAENRGRFTWNEPAGDAGVTAPAPVDQGQSPECATAEEEMKKAAQADETADKLFHNRRALRLCPDNAAYHHSLAQIYLSLGRREDARFEFEEALRLDPNYRAARASLDALNRDKLY